MASQICYDLYGCSPDLINDMEQIISIAHRAIALVGADIVEECSHPFSPVGITYIAVISTSHFSIHTWPECGYVAVDVFSCKESVPETLADFLTKEFGASDTKKRQFERVIPIAGEGKSN